MKRCNRHAQFEVAFAQILSRKRERSVLFRLVQKKCDSNYAVKIILEKEL